MRIDVYVPLLITVLLAYAAPRLAPRLPPRPAAWGLACTALVTAAGWLGSLGLLTFAFLARIPGVAREGRWSAQQMRADDPVVFTVGLGAALVLTAACVALVVAALRQARDLRWSRRQARLLPGDAEIAVVEDLSLTAFAMPGAPGRIVVSRGMLDCLTGAERDALLAHERAHLRHRHHHFKTVWRLVAAANPLLRALAASGEYVLERWADEDAAAGVGDRRTVALAVARASLATSGRATQAAALSATGGPVPRRVRALLAPAPRGRIAPFVAGGLLLALCCVSLAEAASDGREMVVSARYPACAAVPRAATRPLPGLRGHRHAGAPRWHGCRAGVSS